MSRRWIAVATVVVALSVAALGGTILAQSETPDAKDDVIARVAAKVGVDEQTLRDAFAEARAELRDERAADHEARVREHLDEAVAAGQLTQEEADALLERLLSGERFLRGFGPGHRSFGFRFPGVAPADPDSPGLFDRFEFGFDGLDGRLEDLRERFEERGFTFRRFHFGPPTPDSGDEGAGGAATLL